MELRVLLMELLTEWGLSVEVEHSNLQKDTVILLRL